MLSVKLLVNSRLSVKIWGSQKWYTKFQLCRGSAPQPSYCSSINCVFSPAFICWKVTDYQALYSETKAGEKCAQEVKPCLAKGWVEEGGRKVCEEWTLQQETEGQQVPAPGMAQCYCSLHLSTLLLIAFYFPHALAIPTPQQGVRLEGGDRVTLSSWAQSINWGRHLPSTPWDPVNEVYV